MSILENRCLTVVNVYTSVYTMDNGLNMELADWSLSDGPQQAEGYDAGPCSICRVYAPCECDALRLAGAAEVDRLIEIEVRS